MKILINLLEYMKNAEFRTLMRTEIIFYTNYLNYLKIMDPHGDDDEQVGDDYNPE